MKLHRGLAALFLALVGVLVATSASPQSIGAGLPIPQVAARWHSNSAVFLPGYNNLYTSIGDSRDVQNAMVGGSASYATYLSVWTDQKLRPSPTYTPGTAGIGARTPDEIYVWPRIAGTAYLHGAISGNQLTITAPAGTNMLVGTYIQGPLIPSNVHPKIIACPGGTCGPTGVYTLDNTYGPYGDETIQPVWRDQFTVAEVAADQASWLMIQAGTNGAGNPAGTAAMYTYVYAMTHPGFPFPGYRPNDEATDQPLPLYQGKAKDIIIIDEMRRGVTWRGFALSGIDAAALHTHAMNLDKLHYASGDSNANPRVYVAHIFDDPILADLTSPITGSASYLPRAGWLPEGLHQTNVLSWYEGKAIAQGNTVGGKTWPGLNSLLSGFTSDIFLPDTTNYTTDGNDTTKAPGVINSDPLFLASPITPVSGGGLTIEAGSLVPGGVSWQGSGGAGITARTDIIALGGNLGNKLRIHLYGTPTANGAVYLSFAASSGTKRGFIRTQDALRLNYVETSRTITSGYISTMRGGFTAPIITNPCCGFYFVPGAGGTYSGTDQTTDMLLNNVQASTLNGGAANTDAVANITAPKIFQSISLTGQSAPTSATPVYNFNWYSAGGYVDVTVELQQFAVIRWPG